MELIEEKTNEEFEEMDIIPISFPVKAFGSAVFGVNAMSITVEVATSHGWRFYLVGLPDNAVKESEHRVRTAVISSGYNWPRRKIVINMAPADIRKEGSSYDLTIALAILAATENFEPALLKNFVIMGELSLDGFLKPIKGSLPIAIQSKNDGFSGLILPKQNAEEASVVKGLTVYGVDTLKEAVEIVRGNIKSNCIYHSDIEEVFNKPIFSDVDFSDVQGQENIKRSLEIAAAGGHNVILIGPPGAGKTMLAKRLPTILPPMILSEALETTKIHSVAGRLNVNNSLITKRPFRSPHHTISDVALVGGGGNPQPGEISLAHNGVLFLDELPEFKRTVLEVMRQPLEERKVTVSRAKISVEFPANFMLVASMNPCPCGYFNHPEKECVCAPPAVQRYHNKISGPLMDRIDIHVEVTPVSFSEISQNRKSESSFEVRKRVIRARDIQKKRFENLGLTEIYSNAMMLPNQVKEICELETNSRNLLRKAMEKLGLSARAYDRILKVSRTIADLAESESIKSEHIAEAIHFRSLDRSNWG